MAIARMGCPGTRVDQRPAPGRQQVRQGRAGAQQVPTQVDRKGAVEHGQIQIERVGILENDAQIGRVDVHPVKPPQPGGRIGKGGLHRTLVGNVYGHRMRRRAEFGGDPARRRQVDVGNANPGAFAHQPPRRCRADPGARPDDQDRLALHSFRHRPLRVVVYPSKWPVRSPAMSKWL